MKEEGQDSKEKQKYHNDIKKEKIFTKFFSPFFRFYFKAIKGRPDLLINPDQNTKIPGNFKKVDLLPEFLTNSHSRQSRPPDILAILSRFRRKFCTKLPNASRKRWRIHSDSKIAPSPKVASNLHFRMVLE